MSRTLVLWCPDWPVVAAGIVDGVPAYAPVAVLSANRVIACSAAARREGIRRGLRKRETQARCPEIVTIEHDEGRDARAFESIVATVEAIAPGVDVVRPGVCALAARGPARYFGGEERAAEHLVEQVAQASPTACSRPGWPPVRVGSSPTVRHRRSSPTSTSPRSAVAMPPTRPAVGVERPLVRVTCAA